MGVVAVPELERVSNWARAGTASNVQNVTIAAQNLLALIAAVPPIYTLPR
jgi:hypothetical protein